MNQNIGTFRLSELKISAWNINSIWKNINSFRYNKLENPDLINFVCKKQIFGLIETHHTANQADQLHINGFKCFSLCRPKDNKQEPA